MRFTPGPWKAKRQSESTWGVWSKSKKGAVAYCGKEDAHLIAAAPEMKDLLEDAGNFMLDLIHDKETIDDEARAAFDVVLKIGALLRRIEGKEDPE